MFLIFSNFDEAKTRIKLRQYYLSIAVRLSLIVFWTQHSTRAVIVHIRFRHLVRSSCDRAESVTTVGR